MTLALSDDLLLDPTALFGGCGGDPLLMRTMIDSFQLSAPGQLAELRDAAQREDGPALRHAAHKFRGLVSTFSRSIAARMELLEQRMTDQASIASCEIVAEEIKALSKTLSNLSIEELKQLLPA
jgi:HPt (histidine-containing phosphotransfer) domain-containing protein